MKKFLSLLLAFVMLFSLVACGENGDTPAPDSNNDGENTPVVSGDAGNSDVEVPEAAEPVAAEGDYIYKDSVSTLATNWNPHTYQTADDSYPMDYTTDSLYTLIFNDENHPVEGKETFDGYAIVPSMAADLPVTPSSTFPTAQPPATPGLLSSATTSSGTTAHRSRLRTSSTLSKEFSDPSSSTTVRPTTMTVLMQLSTR